MSSPQVLVAVLVGVLFAGYQLQVADNAVASTRLRSGDMFPTVFQQCEPDLVQYCGAADMGAKVSLTLHGKVTGSEILAGTTLTAISEEDRLVKHLSSEEPEDAGKGRLRASAYVDDVKTEESILGTTLAPFPCLEMFWKKNLVSLNCSRALNQLRNVQELRHQQERNQRRAEYILIGALMLFLCSLGIGQQIQLLLKELSKYRFVVWGFFNRWCLLLTFFMAIIGCCEIDSSISLNVVWIAIFLYVRGSKKGPGIGCCKEHTGTVESMFNTSITGNGQIESGQGSCKPSSYSYSGVSSEQSESSCECSIGSGLSSADCEFCGGEELSRTLF
ncbi:hypothetical protein FisN_22Lu252 [Fistulifera solaris]|uniref:Uncharacterized protein n=1 Tax=Fistulifera solaris TaxID=1519565 RepID=A0A1Z5JCL7_FISSO|nr:hypothetical protein FisN_22Lu252 [Fistulifera solaris]|eukprot:GAX11501.1 hypothetical protein FisN_22Lu252 [Fistulifera solaris]